MERIESQRKNVKNWLLKGNSITPIEALQMFGAFRLSAIIFVLKNEDNMNIHTDMIYEPNGRRYARYTLVKEN
jgi:hypothetical protein